MTNFFAAPITILVAALAVGCASESNEQSQPDAELVDLPGNIVPDERGPLVADLQDDSIKSFEFLGCSGDWPDEGGTPDVWRTQGEAATYFLVRHTDACGYNIGKSPRAAVIDGSLELGYELTNTSGEAAACLCEYWARFELAAEPQGIKSISLNGATARLKGDLVVR